MFSVSASVPLTDSAVVGCLPAQLDVPLDLLVDPRGSADALLQLARDWISDKAVQRLAWL